MRIQSWNDDGIQVGIRENIRSFVFRLVGSNLPHQLLQALDVSDNLSHYANACDRLLLGPLLLKIGKYL